MITAFAALAGTLPFAVFSLSCCPCSRPFLFCKTTAREANRETSQKSRQRKKTATSERRKTRGTAKNKRSSYTVLSPLFPQPCRPAGLPNQYLSSQEMWSASVVAAFSAPQPWVPAWTVAAFAASLLVLAWVQFFLHCLVFLRPWSQPWFSVRTAAFATFAVTRVSLCDRCALPCLISLFRFPISLLAFSLHDRFPSLPFLPAHPPTLLLLPLLSPVSPFVNLSTCPNKAARQFTHTKDICHPNSPSWTKSDKLVRERRIWEEPSPASHPEWLKKASANKSYLFKGLRLAAGRRASNDSLNLWCGKTGPRFSVWTKEA